MADRPAETRSEGRLAERALVLTVASLILLTPPILTIFDVPILVFGIPLLHIYSFAVWLVAIALGRWLALEMSAAGPPSAADPTAPGPSDGA